MNDHYQEDSSSDYSNIFASARADHDDHDDNDYDDDDNVNVMRGQTYKQPQLPHHGQSQNCGPPDPIIADSLVGDVFVTFSDIPFSLYKDDLLSHLMSSAVFVKF